MRKSMMVDVSELMELLVVYFRILSPAGYPGQAIKELANLWYWILIPVIGFGIRLRLFSYVKINIRKKLGAAGEINSGLEMPVNIMEI